MRLVLFFDLPVETSSQRRAAQKFVKEIKKLGFYMMQESVYLKLGIDAHAISTTIDKVRKLVPSEGNIAVLTVTEKQFSEIEMLLGERPCDVIDTDERIIEL